MYVHVCVHRNMHIHMCKTCNLFCIKLGWKNEVILVIITCILCFFSDNIPPPAFQRTPELFLGSSKGFLRWNLRTCPCLYFQRCVTYTDDHSGGLCASEYASLMLLGLVFKAFSTGHCHESYSCCALLLLPVPWGFLWGQKHSCVLWSLCGNKVRLGSCRGESLCPLGSKNLALGPM